MHARGGLDRREFLAATAAATLATRGAPADVSYLVVVADQLTWWMTDPAQRGQLDLPHLDRLRAEGTDFERCYSNSPWCPTARGLLRTGVFPHANPGESTLIQPADTVELRMREAGLATRYFGKWHLSPDPDPNEFVNPADRLHWDWFVGHEMSHVLGVTYVHDDPTPLSTAPWDPDVMTDLTLRSMRADVAAGRPFFAQVNYLPPHQPYALYPAYLSVYKQSQGKVRPNVQGLTSTVKQKLAHYMNLVRAVDLEVGRLLAEVDALGAPVVVLFTSDHGDMLHSHGLTYKRKPYEEACRVPLIVCGPGWEPGRVTHPVGLVDLPATLAGIGQGIPLRQWRDSVYLEMTPTPQPKKNWMGGEWRALVTDDGWKLAIAASGPRSMFDLRADPYELQDLAGTGLAREAELEARMREWALATGDGFFG